MYLGKWCFTTKKSTKITKLCSSLHRRGNPRSVSHIVLETDHGFLTKTWKTELQPVSDHYSFKKEKPYHHF